MNEKVYKDAEEAEDIRAKKNEDNDESDGLTDDPEENTDELHNLREALKECEKKSAVNQDLYLRARADLENYKVRASRERTEYIRHANDKVIGELLGIVDNMERAIEHSDDEDSFDSLRSGLIHISANMVSMLSALGLKTVKSVGEPFDPNLHEAISQEESEQFAPGVVVKEFKKGYLLNGRLLRPASVSVATAPDDEDDDEDN